MLDYYYQFLYRTTLYMHIDVQPFTLTISYLYSEAFFFRNFSRISRLTIIRRTSDRMKPIHKGYVECNIVLK